MKALSLAATILLLSLNTQSASGSGAVAQALRGLGKVMKNNKGATGFAATLLGSAGGAAALDRYLADGEAVYALEFDLNNGASSIYWADIIGKPDVFPVLQVAGKGTYLIPEIAHNYSGNKVIWTFRIPQIPSGREINIILCDDDSTSDQIWNNVLSTRIDVSVGGGVRLLSGIEVTTSAGGSLQLVKAPVSIDPPDQLCVYSVTTPRLYFGGDWDSAGELKDGSGNTVGNVRFSQLINK